jgi:hypothetical protein
MIPPEALAILATIGLTDSQAQAVANTIFLVEKATAEEVARTARTQALREANAARQARWRAKRRVTPRNAQITPRNALPTGETDNPLISEEKSERYVTLNNAEEIFKKEGPPHPLKKKLFPLSTQPSAATTSPRGDDDTSRGRRLPQGWQPNENHCEIARSIGVSGSQLAEIVEEFRNYWHSEAGQRSRKIDWDKTFTNRLKEQAKRLNGNGNGRRKGNLVDAGLELIQELEERENRRQNGSGARNDALRLLSGFGSQ